jgi:hypothetical protein
MRAKVILSAAVLAAAIVAAAVYFRNAQTSPPAAEPESDTAQADSGAAAQPVASPHPLRPVQPAASQQAVPPPEESGRALTAPNHQEYVRERKTQLMDLSISQDPNAFNTILSELNNPDPEIRKTALTSVLDIGNPDAIPALQNALTWAQDPAEKLEIQNAIDFLQLPSADQVNAEITAAKAAQQQAPHTDAN